METVYIVLDLETTGSIPGVDEIIEIGAVKIKGHEIIDTFQTLVRPKQPIPPFIEKLTGINDQLLEDAPLIDEVLPSLIEFFTDIDVFIAHNVNFDLSFIEQIMVVKAKYFYDTVELGRIFLPLAPSYGLKKLAEYCKVPLKQHHRGFDDAMATAHIFLGILQVIENLHPVIRQDILRISMGNQWNYWELLSKIHESKQMAFESLSGQAPYPYLEDNSKYQDNLLYQEKLLYQENLLLREAMESYPQSNGENGEVVSTEEIEELLSPEGPLAEQYEGYEYRPQQVSLSSEVIQAFLENKNLVVEAGTGTGKSLGYLIPAALWSMRTGQRLVIATHTINLQEQLLNKDIPTINNTFKLPIKSVLVKGKNNYLCLRKWHNVIFNNENWPEMQLEFYLKVLVWLSSTTSGDKTELNLDYRYNELWNYISCDSESCLNHACSYFNRGCFVQKVRNQAERAHILIVNHSLILADLKTDNRVLPAYQYLVIDEAHHLENEATEHLASSINERQIGFLLNTLYNNRNEKMNPGVLGGFKYRQTKYQESLTPPDYSKFEEALTASIAKTFEIREGFNRFFESLGYLVGQLGVEDEEDSWARVVQITQEIKATTAWGLIETAQENLVFRLQALSKELKKLAFLFEDYNQLEDKRFVTEHKDIMNAQNQLNQMMSDLKFLVTAQEEEFVYWIELISNGRDGKHYIFKGAPIRVGSILAEKLFAEKAAVILTSATLTVEGKFDYYLERVGLDLIKNKKLAVKHLQSPFNYDNKVLLCIPNDLQPPALLETDQYHSAISQMIQQIVTINQGRALVLFTSHKSLKDVYQRLKEPLAQEGINLLGHNLDGNSSAIIDELKRSPKTVIFGTNSFWEGVDIPGEQLTCVIIVKLPFQVPTVPIVAARISELEEAQKDGFRNFSLPNTVIRLKQGFGRLIRTQKDQGIIVILDSRILQKYYGKIILNSLPVKSHIRGESSLIIQKIKEWKNGQRPDFETLNILNNIESIDKFLKSKKKV